MPVREGTAVRWRALGAASCLSVYLACGGAPDAEIAGRDAGPEPVSSSSGGTSTTPNPSVDAGNPSAVDSGSGGMPTPGGHDAGVVDSSVPMGGPSPEAGSLDPSVPPGGNFDLSLWELTLPIGAPTIIPSSQLVGPNGYHDIYFFTDATDGSMTFWDPESGVATSHSDYPRSELREMTAAGKEANWPSSGTNTLRATVRVTQVPDHVAVGQIHLGSGTPASTKPLLELFYYATGAIVLSIEQTPAGNNSVPHPVGNAPLGATWSYVIGLSGNTITLVLDGGATQTFSMSSTFDQENMYFKAGDYDQSTGGSSSVGAEVHFYALSLFHGP